MKIDRKVLLVDDEVEFTVTLAKILSRREITVGTASNCAEALAQMESESGPFTVIIMDVSMPEVNGIQCLALIKREWLCSEVIILTGHASVNTGIEGMKEGAFDYCLKPINTSELLDKIELAFEKVLVNQEQSTQS